MVGDQGELSTCQVRVKLLDGRFDCEGFSFHGRILSFGGAQMSGDVEDWVRLPLKDLGQDSPKTSL